MFSEIEDLMQSIDKFKANIANSDALVASLEAVRNELQQLAASHQEDRSKLLQMSNVLSQIASQTEGISTAQGRLATRIDELVEHLGGMHQEVGSRLQQISEQHDRTQAWEETARSVLVSLPNRADMALNWAKRGFVLMIGLVVLTIASLVLHLI